MKISIYSVTENSRLGTSLTHYLRDKGLSVNYGELSDHFKDGDLNPTLEDVNGQSVYILGVKGPRHSSEVLHGPILAAARAAKDNGARRVVALCPMELYGRAERGFKDDQKMRGKGNLVELVAQTFRAAGIDGYLTIDSHNPQVSSETFSKNYRKPTFFNIDADYFLYRYLLYFSMVDFNGKGQNVVYVKPDKGSRQRVDTLYDLTTPSYPNVSWLEFDKQRLKDNDPDQLILRLTGKSKNFTTCEGKALVFDDDIGETIGTLGKNTEVLTSHNAVTDQIGIPAQKIMYVTHPSFCMWHKSWETEHMSSLERILKSGFDEIITTNTLDYIYYMMNIERRGSSTGLAIGNDMKQFTDDQREMYYELQKKLTIIDVAPTIAKAIIYMENFERFAKGFDINDAFYSAKKNKRVAPFTFLRSHHFRDFKVRMHGNGDIVD
jgi:phosphoribosylpyrophosphate synthetase